MILTPEQQEQIFEAMGREPIEVPEIGEIRCVASDLLETTRWGYIYRTTFWHFPTQAYWQFDMEFGSGDSEIDIYDTEAWEVEEVTRTITEYRMVGS